MAQVIAFVWENNWSVDNLLEINRIVVSVCMVNEQASTLELLTPTIRKK
jgi:hypothetical protein